MVPMTIDYCQGVVCFPEEFLESLGTGYPVEMWSLSGGTEPPAPNDSGQSRKEPNVREMTWESSGFASWPNPTTTFQLSSPNWSHL